MSKGLTNTNHLQHPPSLLLLQWYHQENEGNWGQDPGRLLSEVSCQDNIHWFKLGLGVLWWGARQVGRICGKGMYTPTFYNCFFDSIVWCVHCDFYYSNAFLRLPMMSKILLSHSLAVHTAGTRSLTMSLISIQILWVGFQGKELSLSGILSLDKETNFNDTLYL